MEYFIDNWYVFVAVFAVLFCFGAFAVRYFKMPTEEQLDKVREWLLWAVTQAEKELGAGTGQLKLRAVYDMFVQRFPAVAKMISFSAFSDLVDEALEEMRAMLKKNEAVAAIVEGDSK